MSPAPDEHDFFTEMAAAVARRYASNASKSLRDVYQLNADFLNTRTEASFAFQNREKILGVLADPHKFDRMVDLFVHRAIEFTYASNQFIQIDRQEEARLRGMYAAYLREMERVLAENSSQPGIAAGLSALVEDHFLDLRTNIARFFDPDTGAGVQSNVILQKVVCAEYTPEMQLEILGVQPEALLPPVLDLGCGESGRLVHFLNSLEVAAAGVDRLVEPSPFLSQADWLEYSIESGRWGTVISHMAFSNHFLFHHLYRHGSIEPYARQYMAILKGLKPQGSFYYAPGLPFIEAYLPAETYRIRRRPIVDNLYAAQVTRLG